MKIDTRRTNPKLRLSYSLYGMYKNKDYDGMVKYLSCEEFEPTEAMKRGTIIHKMAEEMLSDEDILKYFNIKFGKDSEIRTTREYYFTSDFSERSVLSGKPDYMWEVDNVATVVDWKSGGVSGYEDQISFYALAISAVDCGYIVGIDDDLKFTYKELVFPDVKIKEKISEMESFILSELI